MLRLPIIIVFVLLCMNQPWTITNIAITSGSMMMKSKLLSMYSALLLSAATAFGYQQMFPIRKRVTSSFQHSAVISTDRGGRRAFLDATILPFSFGVLTSPIVVFAEGENIDYLSMPSDDEVKKAEVSSVFDPLLVDFPLSPIIRLFWQRDGI